ncbi:hypothetical protein TNCV_2295111 [Trichonephila clavipes]|nr:hypothetical protein TNCV_2295111 [Trichonephila clavipes]
MVSKKEKEATVVLGRTEDDYLFMDQSNSDSEDETEVDDVPEYITEAEYYNFSFYPMMKAHKHPTRTLSTNCLIAIIHTQAASSLRASVSVRIIARYLAEGQLQFRRPLRVVPLTSAHGRIRLEWCRARRD